MHIYSVFLFSVFTVGYIQVQVKAFPTNVQCGTVGKRKGRIVNGDVARISQIPWIGSIKYKGIHFCGGTIISSRYILSVAHCFDEPLTNGNILEARNNPNLADYSVTLGEYSLLENEQHSVTYEIKAVIFHEKYKKSPLVNDILLLELASEIQWTDYIRPICLPKGDIETDEPLTAMAAGWGRDYVFENVTGEINNKLRYVELTIFDNNHCNNIYKEKHFPTRIDEKQLCAGKEGGEIRDTNEGDSGGPLLVYRNGKQIVVGLTSCGTPESVFPKAPGVYVRTYKYLDWILHYTQNSKTYFAQIK